MTPSTSTGRAGWVVGGGGLLGGSLSRTLQANGSRLVDVGPIPWDDAVGTRLALRAGVAELFRLAAESDGPTAERSGSPRRWQLAWCAGAGVAGTSDAQLAAEIGALTELFAALTEALAGLPATMVRSGAVFLASSAGGAYAGSTGAPFTELDEPRPTSSYGRAKLLSERIAGRFAVRTGVPVVIGRITNLYGPGQNLDKPQGLISHLCRAYLTRAAVSVFVPLDTIRDYLYVDDCADMIRLALADAASATSAAAPAITKIFAAHQGVTIGALLGEFRRVFKRNPQVVLGASPLARYSASDLRVNSLVWPELDRRSMTSLPAGLAATAADLFRMVKLAG